MSEINDSKVNTEKEKKAEDYLIYSLTATAVGFITGLGIIGGVSTQG